LSGGTRRITGMAPSLHEIATVAVKALDAEQPVKNVPEADPGWNDAFVGAIRDFKETFRGSPDLPKLLNIVSIQNAEDADASQIRFEIDHDVVRVTNDGTPFTAEDVWGICSVGHSKKKNKIGFYGIGFKSVYTLTDLPEIRSGHYALQLEEKIYPAPVKVESLLRDGAQFVLPVKEGRRSQVDELVKQLTNSDLLHLLLTLDHLTSLEIVDRVSGRSGRFYRERVRQDTNGQWEEYRIGGTWRDVEDQIWRRYKFETSPLPANLFREGRVTVPTATRTAPPPIAHPCSRSSSSVT
jgi:hypothetical protein